MTISLASGFGDNLPSGQAKDLRAIITALSGAAAKIAKICARGPLEAGLGSETGAANTDGDAQKALDVRSDDIIINALRQCPAAFYASEERDDIIVLDEEKSLAIACDPLDGSSNIDTNISIGTIFSVFPKAIGPKASFLRNMGEQIAAGFFVYGPATSLIITTGKGVDIYILDRGEFKRDEFKRDEFKLAQTNISIPELSKEYAINASNYHHWDAPIRHWIDDCLLGKSGPFRQKTNMRWVGSLVADAGRILSRGGVFLYPADERKGYGQGRLRLLYECAPVAFIIEQAGGMATDGQRRILDMELQSLHQRVPFVFGSKDNVKTIGGYYERNT